jgi:hypothetical protein
MGTKGGCAAEFAVILILCLAFPGWVYADSRNPLSLFQFDFGVQEEYTDNVDYRSSNKRDEWITGVYGAIRLSTELTPERAPGQLEEKPIDRDPYGINLRYKGSYNHYANDTYDNYFSHEGNLDTWATIGRAVVLRLKDSFLVSDEPLELNYQKGTLPEDFLRGSQKTRARYVRNVLEPSMEFQFGKESRFSLAYLNNYYENENPTYEDSQEHALTPRLELWFNIRHGISLEYSFDKGDFERSPEMIGHLGRGRYNYRFNPRTTIFGEYVFIRRDFDNPGIDYDVQNPSVGIAHAFSANTTGNLQIGYFWVNPQRGQKEDGLSGSATLSTRTQLTTFSISLQGGFREDYFTALNSGLSKYYGAYASIGHSLTKRFTVGLQGSVTRDEYPSTVSNEKVWRWAAQGNATYRVLRWLSFTLEASHMEDDSNLEGSDIQENRAVLRINLTL